MASVIGLWIAFGLLAIGIIAIIISGVRGMINGNMDGKKIVIMLVPVAIFILAFLLTGTWIKAGIATMLIMLALMVLAIFISGARTTFS